MTDTCAPARTGPAPRTLAVASVVAAVAAVALGLAVAGGDTPTAPDRAFAGLVDGLFAGETVARALVLPTEPVVLVGVLGLVVIAALVRRRAGDAAFAVAAPVLAVALNTEVLKPVFERHYDDHLAYPSGHTVSLVAVVAVLVLLADSPRVRVAVAGVGAVALCGAAVGMAVLDYHHVTDVVGGVGVAVAVTAGLAAARGATCGAPPVPAGPD